MQLDKNYMALKKAIDDINMKITLLNTQLQLHQKALEEISSLLDEEEI